MIFLESPYLIKVVKTNRGNFMSIKLIKNKKFKYSIIVLFLIVMFVIFIYAMNTTDTYKKKPIDGVKNLIKGYLGNYEVVDDIYKAEERQVVKFGKTFVKDNKSNKEDAYYYVLKKDDNILTLISLYCIDEVSSDFICENGIEELYKYFDSEYYNNAFNDTEKNMIVDIVAANKSKHKVYLPNAEDVLLMLSDYKAAFAVANYTLYEKMKKQYSYQTDLYTNGYLAYHVEPSVLKPNTIRIKYNFSDYIGSIVDYDIKNLTENNYTVRTKIMVDISK